VLAAWYGGPDGALASFKKPEDIFVSEALQKCLDEGQNDKILKNRPETKLLPSDKISVAHLSSN